MKAISAAPFAAVLLAAAVLGSAPPTARATCGAADLEHLDRAIRRTLVCASRRLRAPDRPICAPVAPPLCADAEFGQVLELVGGMPDSPAVPAEQARCQVAGYRAAHRFLRRRLRERAAGIRPQARSRAALRLARRCDVAVAATPDGPWPRLGGTCTDRLPPPGKRVASDSMSRCLRADLESVASSLLGLPAVRPNIILIVTDDQHPAAISTMDEIRARVFEEGISFSNAFTTTPVCAPSRAGILTGQHAPRHGVTANLRPDANGEPTDGALSFDDTATLATWLQSAGYATALHGKYMNAYRFLSPAIPRGWDDWRVFVDDTDNFFDYDLNENGSVVHYANAESDYSTDVLTERSLRFIESHVDRPFFLMLAPFAPHAPSTPAPRHAGSLRGVPGIALWRPPSWGEVDLGDKPSWFRFFATPIDRLAANDSLVLDQRESLLAVEEGTVRILDLVESRGLADNTIVVFTADSGILWGEHRWTIKQVPYEESLRVPLAIRYPLRFNAGVVRGEMALNLDIAPTLLSLARVSANPPFDGRDLLDLASQEAHRPTGDPDWRTEFVAQHFDGGFTVPPWDSLRTRRFKFVRHATDIDELYDLERDPFELDNLASDPAFDAVRSQLAARLDAQL